MRDAIRDLGGDPRRINPLQPSDLVIDHSVQVDQFGSTGAFSFNARARDRAEQGALPASALGAGRVRQLPRRAAGHRHRPPGEPRVPGERRVREAGGRRDVVYPDTLVGTDSHTTMINGLGVLGWGVGGIEAEAAMLGQPMPMLTPEVIGFKLTGQLREGATATDLVLTVTQMLRAKGVVGKFVEFYGTGLSVAAAARPRDDRQHGAGVRRDDGLLPVRRGDARLPALHRSAGAARRAGEAYTKAQGLFRTDDTPEPLFTDTLHLDLGDVEPSIAGPRAPAGPRAARRSRRRRGARPSRRCSRGRRRHRPARARARGSREGGSATVGTAPTDGFAVRAGAVHAQRRDRST